MNVCLLLACAIASIHAGPPPPAGSLRTDAVRRYTMSGYIRPLLFWMGREGIGLARVSWRQGAEGARGYELLIGTDPARAPRSINRWGYIAEETRGREASLLALMTRADESSYEEAAASTSGGRAKGDFRAVQAAIASGVATWQTAPVRTPEPLTIHDVDAALERVVAETLLAARREMRVSTDVRPGFLTTLAELIDRAVHRPADRGAMAGQSERVRYIFAGKLYELYLRSAQRGTGQFQNASIPTVRMTFEILTLATNARTRFEIVSGTDGSLAGVPVMVAWQPRWWLKVRLDLIG